MVSFFGPSQDELEEARMKAHAMTATFYEMMDSLTQEQLVALGAVLRAFMEEPGRTHSLHGEVKSMLRLKFGVCACGEDHLSTEALKRVTIERKPPSDNPL